MDVCFDFRSSCTNSGYSFKSCWQRLSNTRAAAEQKRSHPEWAVAGIVEPLMPTPIETAGSSQAIRKMVEIFHRLKNELLVIWQIAM